MKNFIEKNSKWIVRIFVLIGIFLIIKLGYFGVYWICSGGGGYISLCIIPNYIYFWTNAGYISIIFGIIGLLIMIGIYFMNNKILKVLLAFIILLLGLSGKTLFYYVSPDFKFYYTDEYLEYMDKDFQVKDIDLYLKYMGKYCNESIDDFKYKNVGRDSMCGGRYLYDFKTVDEYKKVFDFANKNNIKELYRLTFLGAERFGLEKVIEGYIDDTFYGYVINYIKTFEIYIIKNDINLLKIMQLNTDNNEIQYILSTFLFKINIISNLKNLSWADEKTKWKLLHIAFYKKLKQIRTVNTKIF